MIPKTICCIDTGVFQSWAQRLARDYERVLYYRPDPPKPVDANDDAVGTGFEEFERIYDFWGHLDEIDTFMFLHVQWGAMAEHLRSIGKRVWSSFYGECLELDREIAKQALSDVGLSVVPYEMVTGIDELKDYLEDHGEQIVKVSRVRELVETFPARNPIVVEMKLDKLQAALGPLKNTQRFMVEEVIDAVVEVGYEGYCVNGEFPKTGFWGVEVKDQSYLGRYDTMSTMPKSIRETNLKIASELMNYRYCGFFHTEIRQTKKEFYPVDFTCRCASPPGESLQEMITNLGEVIEGAVHGQVIEPKPAARFAAQAVIMGERASDKWIPVIIPGKLTQWVKLYHSMKQDDVVYTIPMFDQIDVIGYVIGIGNTIDAAISKVEEHAEAVKNSEIIINTKLLEDAKEEFSKAL